MEKLNDLKYYQNYHKHTSLSHRYNKDSPLTYKDYFNHIKNNYKNYPQIYSTVEHGWQGNYFHIYDDLEKFNKDNNMNIKFIFGTEAYWVENRFSNDSSNNHICLLAMNNNGRKKLNRAIYESFKSGYYYKNRMDLDILLSLPKDDIFVTTACIAFWLKYSLDNNEYNFEKIDEIVLKLNNHFTNFYLEVQANNTDKQKKINEHIIRLHNKYNIPIICGTDSHVINMEQMTDRDDLLKSNKISYEDEDGNYMDFPSVELLIDRFHEQGILTDDEIYEAISNTNKILDFEDIVLDRSLKVPVLKSLQDKTQEERNEILKQILIKEWNLQKDDINKDKYDEYIKAMNYELKEIYDCNMADYFIDTYEIMKRGQEVYGGILTPSGRGSGVSEYINKLLRFTKVDRINSPVIMYPERFLTSTRVLESHTPPDIDHNVSDREPFIQAQRDLIGDEGTFDLLALGTLKYKSAFKMYSRAYNVEPTLANEVTKEIAKYEEALKHAEDDEDKESIDIYNYVDKEKYGYLIDGCQQYMGIVDNLKAHPCGTCCYDGDAIEDIGVIMVKSESQGEKAKETFVALIESGTIDAFGVLKQDYLIVDSIGLTYDIYKEVGIEPFTVNELLKKIDSDEKTWNIYKDGYTMCVNQCEKTKSTQKVMRYKPKNISEVTQFVAGIRPSFQSMYKIFESRQHFDYGIKAFDDLLQDEYCSSSFILYQESLMKVLGFAGFPMSETYTIIKAISKKKHYVISNAKEKFIPNFAQAILNTKETDNIDKATEMAQKVWQIIEDSAQYGFNSAHAYCMAIDSVTIAYLKAHYPLEFYKVVLQRYTDKGNKDKVSLLKKEMIARGISLKPIKFRDDNRKFSIDKENNYINQTMASIKNIQKVAPTILYEIGLKEHKNLFYVFQDILNSELNKKTIDIMIKLDYFSEYGDINFVLNQLQIYQEVKTIKDKLSECKQLKKDYCELIGLNMNEVSSCCKSETAKMFKEIDNKKLLKLFNKEYLKIIDNVSSKFNYIKITDLEKLKYEIMFLGTTEITIPNCEFYGVEFIETNNYGTPFITLYNISNGTSQQYKCDRKWFKEYPCEVGDILDCVFGEKNKRKLVGTDDNGKNIWEESDEKENVLKVYSIQ